MLQSKSSPVPYRVSKFQKSSVLLEVDELEALFALLQTKCGPLYFYHIGAILEESALEKSQEMIVKQYGEYIEALKKGQKERVAFSIALTLDPDTLYTIDVGGGKKIAKLLYPSVHMTSNAICYLPELHTFKEKLYGQDLIPWGLQFSYPQLFQDSITQGIHNAMDEFVNARLFKQLMKELRASSLPTFFFTKEGVVKTTIRLGRECRSWIDSHPQLQEADIRIILT